MMLDDAMPALSGKGKASIGCREDAMGNRIAPIGATIKALVEEFWNELMECGMKMFRRLLD